MKCKKGGKGMYINPFAAGVAATVLVELIAIVAMIIIGSKRK